MVAGFLAPISADAHNWLICILLSLAGCPGGGDSGVIIQGLETKDVGPIEVDIAIGMLTAEGLWLVRVRIFGRQAAIGWLLDGQGSRYPLAISRWSRATGKAAKWSGALDVNKMSSRARLQPSGSLSRIAGLDRRAAAA